MKRLMAGFATMFFLAIAVSPALAGGDKVRGEKGEGEVNQVNFDAQGNQN